jgi:hypothetical protein
MRKLLLCFAASCALFAQGPAKVYLGVITDTMCGLDHAHMGATDNAKCVRDCVKTGGGKWKYALHDGKNMYVLSDQQTPEKFAAQKVKVTGTLYEKTKIIKVEKIEAMK